MSGLAVRRGVLHARLWLARLGWANAMAVVLCTAGIAIWVVGVPSLRAQVFALAQAPAVVGGGINPIPLEPPPLAERRANEFYAALGERRYAEQQVKSLFAIAAANGLTLNQGEYKWSYDKAGHFHAYKILLPVKGQYNAIRQFCEEVLRVIPFASLDEMNFKRDGIGNTVIEASLRITLYLADVGTAPPSISPDAVAIGVPP